MHGKYYWQHLCAKIYHFDNKVLDNKLRRNIQDDIQNAFSRLFYMLRHLNQDKCTGQSCRSWKPCEMDLSHNCSLHGEGQKYARRYEYSATITETGDMQAHLRTNVYMNTCIRAW